MPGLLKINHEKDFKIIVLKVRKPYITKFEPYPCLRMSWDSDCFRAIANMKTDFDSAFKEDPPSITTAKEIHCNKGVSRLVAASITTVEDLKRIAPYVHRMASTVFRDAWLLYKLSQEENWVIPESQMFVDKDSERLVLMRLEVHRLGLECSVGITIREANARCACAFVVSPRVTPACPVQFWQERFDCLGAPPPIEHLVIHHYQTHADADRVMDTLRVLLRP